MEGGEVLVLGQQQFDFTPRLYPFEGYYIVRAVPVNREQKRLFLFETNDIIRRLYSIENEFIYYLFGEDSVIKDLEYMVVYNHFCERYEYTVDWINRVQKPKCVELRRDYFRNEYKSQK